jgi:hypothetical protein
MPACVLCSITERPRSSMNAAEKKRLTSLVPAAVAKWPSVAPPIRERAQKLAAKYSPTNATSFRDLSEVAWWLIAVDALDEAIRLLDALCAVNDKLYWMPQALASAHASRAWAHGQRGDRKLSSQDARSVLRCLEQDPNYKPVTKREASNALKRFDGWLDRERRDESRAPLRAACVLAHALRVLVLYQQLAKADCPGAQGVTPPEYRKRMEAGLLRLRDRLESL